MANERAPMMCPRCRIPMNRHAEKPCDPRTREEARAVERGGTVIAEVHCCPKCGGSGSRRTMLA